MERIDFMKVAPGAYRAMAVLEHYLHDNSLETAPYPSDQAASIANQRVRLWPRHALKDLKSLGELDQRL